MIRLLTLAVVTAACSHLAVAADPPPPPAVAAVKKKQPDDVRSPAEQLATFKLPEHFKIELVAAEPTFYNPVALAQDERGRLYVSESHTYRWGPKGSPVDRPSNPIVRLDPAPDGKGFTRTVVVEGFDDPVMGMLVRDNKLWASSCQFLYLFDLDENGKGVNRKTLITDKAKAWNPFGMFGIEWGPDGWIYMSVGDHNIELTGTTNSLKGRGRTGLVVRFKPDGSNLEQLALGLRVPYSFELDPFGQLWLLSNGEGNPNRYLRVIQNVDYHCFTRGAADNEWLAGRRPTAPPTIELPRGANTALLHYYGAAFGPAFQGSQLAANWGAHGGGNVNHTIDRYVPDDHGRITMPAQTFVGGTDPRFRPTYILAEPAGTLLIADWYGRDDENDLTGRIWRVSYTGPDAAAPFSRDPKGSASTAENADIVALSSPAADVRERATHSLSKQGDGAVEQLSALAAKHTNPLAAAGALWALARVDTVKSRVALTAGADHPDWRVRRLSLRLAKRFNAPNLEAAAAARAKDPDPFVRVEAAADRDNPADAKAALLDAITSGAADADPALRYEAAWHLARHADAATFAALTASDNPNVRLAGLIVIDVALYEQTPVKPAAEAALTALLENVGPNDLDDVLRLAGMNKSPAYAGPLAKLFERADVPPAALGQIITTLKSLAPVGAPNMGKEVAARWIDAVQSGKAKLNSNAERRLLLELLPTVGPTPFALEQVNSALATGDGSIVAAAHVVARQFGKAAGTPAVLATLSKVLAGAASPENKIEALATLAAVEPKPDPAQYIKLLSATEPLVVKEAVRSWRRFTGDAGLTNALLEAAPKLIEKDPTLKPDLAYVLAALKVPADKTAPLALPAPVTDRAAVRQAVAAAVKQRKGNDPRVLGRQVFARAGCAACHSTGTDVKVGPPLAGINAQPADYLIESILEPSKVIKTGFESEIVETTDGDQHVGLAREDEKGLRILTAGGEIKLAKSDIKSRRIQKLSLMPEGFEQANSPDELADLIAYLQSIPAAPKP